MVEGQACQVLVTCDLRYGVSQLYTASSGDETLRDAAVSASFSTISGVRVGHILGKSSGGVRNAGLIGS